MQLKISHLTKYNYDAPVEYALQELRLTPKSYSGQNVIDWQTKIDGGKKELEFEDQHNNIVNLVKIESGRSDISILCEGEVETADTAGIVGEVGGCAPLWYFKRSTSLTEPGPNTGKLIQALGEKSLEGIERMHALSDMISKSATYEVGKTHPGTTAEEALESGYGVCQDHAHIFLAVARQMGFPARYVSGYLMMSDRVQQDATHAWAEAYFDSIGWIGFDVSNGISPDDRYIRVATGLDYRDAAPISGMRYGKGNEAMDVTLQVQQ